MAEGPALAWAERREEEIAPSSKSILAEIDPEKVSEGARRESRNREVHLPPLSTFRWWARRTGAVNAAVLDAAMLALGRERLDVFDPFAGGGTIPLVALRDRHRVHARDLNPWAVEGMRRMFDLPAPEDLEAAYEALWDRVAETLKRAYGTTMEDGTPATIAHTYRVAVGCCSKCQAAQRQFPYSMITLLQRKEREQPEAFLACPSGHVFEGRTDDHLPCQKCGLSTDPAAFYTPRRFVTCSDCGHRERLSDRAAAAGWDWEVVLVERACEKRREFAIPTESEIEQASEGWKPRRQFGEIPTGSETRVLLRHGFSSWEDLYPRRQRVVTETLLDQANEVSDDERVVDALRMAVIGTAEFAGHLNRWDRFYLKCNDATAGHRFNFSTFVPEPNVWGAGSIGRGTVTRRIRSMAKAARWLRENGISGEDVRITEGDSAELEEESLYDLILTDPPYHDDVHYGELSLLFRGWAGLSMENLEGEAAANAVSGLNADDESYASSLSRVFSACHSALRSDGRLVFSFANHEPSAWVALFAALQRAGFFAVACVSVHSENETDFKKRGIRSCTEDLLLELSPVSFEGRPERFSRPDDGTLMDAVISLFLRVGSLQGDWEDAARKELRKARDAELVLERAGKKQASESD